MPDQKPQQPVGPHPGEKFPVGTQQQPGGPTQQPEPAPAPKK